MKPHTYPTGRFNRVALVAEVCICNRSSPGLTHFQEKRSTISTPFEILEHSCLVPRLRKKKTKHKTPQHTIAGAGVTINLRQIHLRRICSYFTVIKSSFRL